MENRFISFSPPDISKLEISEVCDAMQSGWITTGPRTKMLENRLAAYIETGRTDIDCSTKDTTKHFNHKVVCLNSATTAEELNLCMLGVGPGDEVIVPAYTYTAIPPPRRRLSIAGQRSFSLIPNGTATH